MREFFLRAEWLRTPWRSSLGVLILLTCFALVCAIWVHSRAWVVFVAASLLLSLGVIWPLVSLKGFQGSIRFERLKATEGQKVCVKLQLHNRWPWTINGLALGEGLLTHDGTDDRAIVGLVHLGAREQRELILELSPPVRGIYPLSEVSVSCGFPFGIWTASKTLTVENTLLVRPKVLNLPPLPEQSGQHLLQGQQLRELPGDVGDVLGTRPYREGDSVRKVHWALTARYDRMIVCERQTLCGTRFEVIPDLDPSVHAGSGPDSSREWVIRLAASITARAMVQNADIDVVLNRKTYSGESLMLSGILDALARLPADGCRLHEMMQKTPQHTQLIITTDRRLAESGAEALSHRNRYFFVLKTPEAEPLSSRERTLIIEDPHKLPSVLFPTRSVSNVA